MSHFLVASNKDMVSLKSIAFVSNFLYNIYIIEYLQSIIKTYIYINIQFAVISLTVSLSAKVKVDFQKTFLISYL